MSSYCLVTHVLLLDTSAAHARGAAMRWQGCSVAIALPPSGPIPSGRVVERVHHRLRFPRRRTPRRHRPRASTARRSRPLVGARTAPAHGRRGRAAPRRARRRRAAAGTRRCRAAPVIDLSPLCPPADPRARARSRPSGRFASSTMTSRSGSSMRVEPDQLGHRVPLRFMNVSGLPRSAAAVRAIPQPRHHRLARARSRTSTPWRRASSSATSKPTLCRVPRYFAPGLPRPAMSFTSGAR